jgi:hypothetical protein
VLAMNGMLPDADAAAQIAGAVSGRLRPHVEGVWERTSRGAAWNAVRLRSGPQRRKWRRGLWPKQLPGEPRSCLPFWP